MTSETFPQRPQFFLNLIKAAYDEVTKRINAGEISPELLNEQADLADKFYRARNPGLTMGGVERRKIGADDQTG